MRESRGLSQEKLAEAVGTSTTTISRIESGKQILSAILVGKIAEYLSVSADYLLGRAVHGEDLPDDLRELFELAVDAGYAADLKDFFRWLKAKRDKLAHEPTEYEADEELLALVPGLTREEIAAILNRYDGKFLRRIAGLSEEEKKVFDEEAAKILRYLELEQKVRESEKPTENGSM